LITALSPFVRRASRLAAGALALSWFVAPALLARDQALPESVVKAEMIRRFPEFVAWPGAILTNRDDIELCFSPSHPFGATAAGLTNGPQVHGHSIRVRELKKGDRLSGCHVVYVAPADPDVLESAKPLPILTVGDQKDFCRMGGIINFQVQEGRVRFEVNVAQARKAGLRLDSQFLRLAITLHGGLRP
jgi:hypothetical protein